MRFDIFIKNAKYPDYLDSDFKVANIGIIDDKIEYIGNETFDGINIIDAKDKIVSPGFIDIHMHEENFKDEGEKYVISKMMLRQGVTTCVGGNCGVLHQTIKEFREVIERSGGAPVNYIMLTGYNKYRTDLGIGHYDKINKDQMNIIRYKMLEDINNGASGISFGIEYDPGITFDEMIYAINCTKDDNLLITAHYREDAKKAVESVKEMIDIQNHINKRFQISHLSSCSAMGLMKKSLDIINEAIEKNSRLNYDTYPYNAFSTTIGSTVFDDGFLESYNKEYSDLLLTDEPYKNVRCNEKIFKEVRKNYPDMLVVAFCMNENEIIDAIKNKYGMIASDGIINNGKGHPRAAGTFPRVLGKYVRQEKVISLIDALKKMTIEPSKRLMIDDKKGQIKLGYDADITIFDENTIIDGATFDDINIASKGIDYVIVNGIIVYKDMNIVSENAGRFIEAK